MTTKVRLKSNLLINREQQERDFIVFDYQRKYLVQGKLTGYTLFLTLRFMIKGRKLSLF